MARININNRFYDVPDNITIYEACNKMGINIPALCYDDRLQPISICELAVVEIGGTEDLINSCSHRVAEGMAIRTNSDRVISERKRVLNSLLSNHVMDCEHCADPDDCKLHAYCEEYRVTNQQDSSTRDAYPIDESNQFYIINPNKCIACNLCVRVCDELQGKGSLELSDKGYVTRKSTVECESCGNCVSVCPVGAIIPKSFDEEYSFGEEYAAEMALDKKIYDEKKNVKTTCSYCGVGCQLELVVKNNKVVDVNPVKTSPNNGLLCVKGKFGHKYINHPDRLKTPLIRKDGRLVESTWEEAYSLIIGKARDLQENYSNGVFAGLSSARCTNEENYLFQKLIRAVLRTNNIDHCARL